MIVSPEVIVEAAGPLGDAPSRPIKAFYNLCGYDPSEESPILLSWIGDFFLSGGLPKMATCSESKQFTVCSHANTETTKIYAIPSVDQLRDALSKGEDLEGEEDKAWEGQEDEMKKLFGL